MKKFSSGAVRSNDADGVRLDLVPVEGLMRAGAAAAHGAAKYGEHNWQKGMPLSEFLNHLLVHIYKYLSGDRSEDHLGHAAWNAMAACHAEKVGWDKGIPEQNGKPTEETTSASAMAAFQQALLEEYNKAKRSPTPAPPVHGTTADDLDFSVVEQKKVGDFWEVMLCVGLGDNKCAFITIRSSSVPSRSELAAVVKQYLKTRGGDDGDEEQDFG